MESLVGYRTKTKQGLELKSTTVFIRNSKNKIVGALCINIDLTPYISAKNSLEELFFSPEKGNRKEEKEKSSERFESSVDSLINELIQQGIKRTGETNTLYEKER